MSRSTHARRQAERRGMGLGAHGRHRLLGMDRLNSAQVRFCTTRDEVQIAYASRGRGPVMVKTPNWMNHVELDVHSKVWSAWIERFEQDRTLVRYDARGCGLSDRTPRQMSFETNQLDLEAVVEAAGLHRFILYGASQGAAIAIEYAARHPDRVSHLVLCGAYLQGAWTRPAPAAVREEAAALLKLVELGWGRENSAFRQVFANQFIPSASVEQLAAFDEIQRKTVSPETAAVLLRTFYEIDVTSAARRVQCPTLVLHATQDARVPFEEGRRLASAVPRAELVPLDTPNHILLQQDPAWRRQFDEVDQFIERHPDIAVRQPERADLPFDDLTAAERRVVDLVASGMGNRDIATRLQIAEKTVRNHINHIFSKLGLSRRSQLIVLARDAGFGRGFQL
jgi:pimeloyl-ACP methyl ester carboxylesterase/DNA-binding CsgD family transcriptional regulator